MLHFNLVGIFNIRWGGKPEILEVSRSLQQTQPDIYIDRHFSSHQVISCRKYYNTWMNSKMWGLPIIQGPLSILSWYMWRVKFGGYILKGEFWRLKIWSKLDKIHSPKFTLGNNGKSWFQHELNLVRVNSGWIILTLSKDKVPK